MRLKENGHQLLPGIPNEITLDHVTPKLSSWEAFHTLSSVSRGWQRAIGSRQVYDARVRSQSTETLIALKHDNATLINIAVYSMNDNTCYQLPPIPGVDRGIPYSCQCVSLDGKLYILGGTNESKPSPYPASADVYEFDLAGLRQWKHCASMEYPREEFGCGVIGGKIYVFGGTAQYHPVFGSEVYDPVEDSWSPITAQAPWRFNQKVTTVGEELFVHTALTYYSDFFEWAQDRVIDPYDSSDERQVNGYIDETYSADVYHPLKEEWREVEKFNEFVYQTGIAFTVKGNLHKMRWGDIQVFDTCSNSWKHSQRLSWDLIGGRDSITVTPLAAVVLDEELLAIVRVSSLPGRSGIESEGICIVKSEGLGGENKELVWRKAQCSVCFEHLVSRFMCPVQL